MATNSSWAFLLLIFAAGSAWPHDPATPSECQAVGSQPAVSNARAKAQRDSSNIRAQIALADAWNDAGCYNEAVTVLQDAVDAHPGVSELQTRLRVAKSLVGEEHFFDDLDRADRQAKLKRDTFRCENLGDLDACNESVRLQPDDAVLLTSVGDALMRAKHSSEALQQYRRAKSLGGDQAALTEKIRLAEADLPPAQAVATVAETPHPRVARASLDATGRRYSNASPPGQSH